MILVMQELLTDQQSNPEFESPLFFRLPLACSVFLNLVIVIVCIFFYFRLQPQIPIFYSLAEVDQHLADKKFIFIFPGISIFFNLMNFFLIKVAFFLDRLILKLFAWVTFFWQLILTVIVIRLIWIIT